METLIVVLLITVIILQIILLNKKPKPDVALGNYLQENNRNITQGMNNIFNSINSKLDYGFREVLKESNDAKGSLNSGLQDGLDKLQSVTEKKLDSMEQTFRDVIKENSNNHQTTIKELHNGLDKIHDLTEKKLQGLQNEMSSKLDVSLNERLDKNFENITTQLTTLYKSLGELESMSNGIDRLNKTLSNIKTRGNWGELQLGSLIEETMQPTQYETNVKLKSDSNEVVEYAIKIPSKEDSDEFIYLPIDAKFPLDQYNKVVDASNQGNQDEIIKAKKELSYRIKEEARSIHDKYVVPPKTTDFAIMFLPTESMYIEVIHIDGLMEYCQNQYRIVISGPSTITALMNSLRLGFANIALNKKTAEVRKLLQAVKTQYSKLDELIDTTKKRIESASKSTDELKARTDLIQKRLAKIDMLEMSESNELLEIEELN